MKIIVLVKQTFATEARISLDENGRISERGVKKVVNPYDEFAVEEAIQLKEKGTADYVGIVTVGTESAQESSRQCLAMGADEAVLINAPEVDPTDSVALAEILATYLKGVEFDLILSGCVAVDDNSAQVPARVAEILDLPQITVVSRLEVGEGEVTAWREADGRTEVLSAPLPALVTADKSLNKPRYPTLPNIMKAKKKPLHVKTLSDLGIESPQPKVRVSSYELPPPKEGAKIFEGTPAEAAAALVQALRNEAKVI